MRDRGVGILCYSPLAQGLLSGRYANASEVPDGLARTRWYAGDRPQATHGEVGCEAEVFAAVEEVRRIAGELGQSMAVVSLAWARQQQAVTSILVGARNPQELAWDLPAADLKLADDVVLALARATEPVKKALAGNPDMWLSPSRMR